MTKTLGLSFTNAVGKTYRGIAADNHVVYNIFGGIRSYSITMVLIGGAIASTGILSAQKIIEHNREKH